MGTSIGRNDGVMIDSSAVAISSDGISLEDMCFHKSDTLTSSGTLTISDNRITTNHRVVNPTFGTPTNLTSDINWDTNTAGQVTFTYTASGNCSIAFDLLYCK